MVFKPFANLARQGITKHLVTGGYAQSVVAASQSLPIIKAHTATPSRVGNFGGHPANRPHYSTHAGQANDSFGGIYSAHGLSHEDVDKDAKRYLFSKKILWSKAQHQTKELSIQAEETSVDTVPLPIPSLVESQATEGQNELSAVTEEGSKEAAEAESAQVPAVETAATPAEPNAPVDPLVMFNAELDRLKMQGRFKDITVLVSHMFDNGLQPNTETFNYLLAAISQLIRLEVLDNRIHHVLDVYSDLLRRKLTPNTKTYAIILTALVKSAKRKQAALALREEHVHRFGFVPPAKPTLFSAAHDEGDGITIALDLFYASTCVVKNRAYSVDVYNTLIEACSQRGLTDDMVRIYTQMEASGVRPNNETHLALIDGFGKAKDVHSVLEVYEEVKNALEKQIFVLQTEKDRLYKHLVMAYIAAGDPLSASSFYDKVFAQRSEHSEIILEGFVEGFLQRNDFIQALQWVEKYTHVDFRPACNWASTTLAKASDAGDYDSANEAYWFLERILSKAQESSNDAEMNWVPKTDDIADAKFAFLALCSRIAKIDRARELWAELMASQSFNVDTGALVTYVKMLFQNGYAAEAIDSIAKAIVGLEADLTARPNAWKLADGWRNIFDFLNARGLLTSEVAANIWKVSGYTSQGPLPSDCIALLIRAIMIRPLPEMPWPQLDLIVQMNACKLIYDGPAKVTIDDAHRFEQAVSVATASRWPMEAFTKECINQAVTTCEPVLQPDFLRLWADFLAAQSQHRVSIDRSTHEGSFASPTLVPSEVSADDYDPNVEKMDVRMSNTIDGMIDKKKYMSDIMRAFRGARESGKILKYQTIARLIGLAARNKLSDPCKEVFAAAKKDIPILTEFSASKYGWCCIYDAMIAACLNFGEFKTASKYRDEMAEIGGVPSANTYGLFIVNLKQTHETFDEASEAVKLFELAKNQNVYPTAFLYNAVIGKLARARRVDDCLYYYSEMRALGLKPTSVTYGTMINALCRVSDERYAEELFQEMESMPNYKPRAAPYNSMIQFFAITKRDRTKVLQYYNRMETVGIEPTGHTYKLLIDAYASLDPPDIKAAESILDLMRNRRVRIECTHHASLIHAKGCVLQDVEAALKYFHKITDHSTITPDAILYQALFEALVANHRVHDTPRYLDHMRRQAVKMTPYIANTLIHGWALEKNILKAKEVYDSLSPNEGAQLRREPSTYEAMTRAYLAVEDRSGAMSVVEEMLKRGYPTAVMSRVLDLVKGGGIGQTVVV